ncbi:RNA-directed DNA polymerase, eukaryota [Tanacetum coccineum]
MDKEVSPMISAKVMNFSQAVQEEVSCNSAGQSEAKNGGSVLGVLEEVIRVGQAMGYSMEGCLGNKTKKEWVKELTNKNKINFIAIQETKMERVSHMDVKFMWGNSNYDYVCSDSLGNSGGILCIWEETVFKKDYVTISDSFVAIYGTWIPNKAKILIVAIYAPQQPMYRRVLWDYMSILLSRWNGEVILMGDFNEVRTNDERRGSWFNSYNASLFDQFISSSGLVDVKMEGYAFTWSHPSANKMSKLDRFLVSDGVISLFPSITAVCLDRHLSDHRPILLCEVKLDYGPIPFRLNGMIHFKKKLQELKKIIRYWIKDKNSQLSCSKQSILKELCDIDKELDQGRVSDSSLLRRHELKCQLNDIKVMEATDSLQKSKVRWAAFIDHYGTRFKKPTMARLKLNFSFPNRLSQEQVADLERGVSRDEIRSAVWDCGENKSPGPDGFTFEFFKRYWEFIGPDFCDAVEHFFVNGSFSKGCNSSFIALIPKVPDAKFVNDYRPISLIGSVYKVVTKIMANRLALVIADIVSETQSAFVAERQILDGPFILNEVLHWCKKKNKKAMFFKVDFSKAYDSVRWDFLIDVLEAFGFGATGFESLHLSISRAVNEGLFKGIRLHGSLSLSHLFYADDAFKSQVLGVGVPRSSVEAMAASIGCSIMQNKFRYLGVMVGECMSRHKAWDDVVLKLRTRLSKWKAKTLSIGGRLTLLKSVLGASPLYTMSIFKVPKASKKKGGLGVSSFHALNRALLLKWVWLFVSQDGSLWFRVIQAVYGSTIDTHSIQTALIWSSILREVQVLKANDKPFRDEFPRMFTLELNQQISVAAKLAASLEVSLRRLVRGGLEQQQFSELSSIIHSVSLSSSFDRWVCSVSSDGDFSVKEVRNVIDELYLPLQSESTRWVNVVPIKINIFAWRARRDCLPTRSNLIRRGVSLESSSCPLCLTGEKDVHHVFFRCSLSRAVFNVYVDGGILIGRIGPHFRSGIFGFLLFGFHLKLKVY